MTARPNIVYILADDLGYGDIGANNEGSIIPTPNLDRLAAQGTLFTDAHATSSVCTPSRYSILTGRYCWRTPLKDSVLRAWDPPLIEPDRRTVAGLLRRAGYRTACIGKWHLGWEWATRDGRPASLGARLGQPDVEIRRDMEKNIDYARPMRGGPVDCGFDSYFGVDVPNFPPYTWFAQDHLLEAPAEQKPAVLFGMPGLMVPGWKHEAMIPEFVRRSEELIASAGPEPFFLYLALTSPHTPIVPNRRFIGVSGAGLYGDFVCEVDWVVGRVMAALAEKGIADDTLLIFTSDNGPECLAHAAGGAYERARLFGHYSMGRLRGVKRDTWEGGHRVPFVARWPGVTPAAGRCDRLVSLGDLAATCAEITGIRLSGDDAPDSVSMLPLLRGEERGGRDSLVHHSHSGRFALRRGKWVFIDAPAGDDNRKNGEPEWFRRERGYAAHRYPGELFDLEQDIAERRNRYGECPAVVAEMSARLREVVGEDGGSGRGPGDPGPAPA